MWSTCMWSMSKLPLALLHVLHPPAPRLAADAGARMRQPFDLKGSIEGCQQQWGVTPRPMWPTVAWGGKRIETASNIVFTNGLLDPWCAAALGAQGRLAAAAWVGVVQPCIRRHKACIVHDRPSCPLLVLGCGVGDFGYCLSSAVLCMRCGTGGGRWLSAGGIQWRPWRMQVCCDVLTGLSARRAVVSRAALTPAPRRTRAGTAAACWPTSRTAWWRC